MLKHMKHYKKKHNHVFYSHSTMERGLDPGVIHTHTCMHARLPRCQHWQLPELHPSFIGIILITNPLFPPRLSHATVSNDYAEGEGNQSRSGCRLLLPAPSRKPQMSTHSRAHLWPLMCPRSGKHPLLETQPCVSVNIAYCLRQLSQLHPRPTSHYHHHLGLHHVIIHPATPT